MGQSNSKQPNQSSQKQKIPCHYLHLMVDGSPTLLEDFSRALIWPDGDPSSLESSFVVGISKSPNTTLPIPSSSSSTLTTTAPTTSSTTPQPTTTTPQPTTTTTTTATATTTTRRHRSKFKSKNVQPSIPVPSKIPTQRTENISDHVLPTEDGDIPCTMFHITSHPDSSSQRFKGYTHISSREYYRLYLPLYHMLHPNALKFYIPFHPKLYHQHITDMLNATQTTLLRCCIDYNFISYPFTILNSKPPSIESTTSPLFPHPFKSNNHVNNSTSITTRSGSSGNATAISSTSQTISQISASNYLFSRFLPYSYPFLQFITFLFDIVDPFSIQRIILFFRGLQTLLDFGFPFPLLKIPIYIIVVNCHLLDQSIITIREIESFVEALPFERVFIKQISVLFDEQWLEEKDNDDVIDTATNTDGGSIDQHESTVFNTTNNNPHQYHFGNINSDGEPSIIDSHGNEISITAYTRTYTNSSINYDRHYHKPPKVPPIKLLFLQIILEEYHYFLDLQQTDPQELISSKQSSSLQQPELQRNTSLPSQSSHSTVASDSLEYLTRFPNTFWNSVTPTDYLTLAPNRNDLARYAVDDAVLWRTLSIQQQIAFRKRPWVPIPIPKPIYFSHYKQRGYQRQFDRVNLEQIMLSQAINMSKNSSMSSPLQHYLEQFQQSGQLSINIDPTNIETNIDPSQSPQLPIYLNPLEYHYHPSINHHESNPSQHQQPILQLDPIATIPSPHHYYAICTFFGPVGKGALYSAVTNNQPQFFNSPLGIWDCSLSNSIQTTYHNIQIKPTPIPSSTHQLSTRQVDINPEIYKYIKPTPFPLHPRTSLPITATQFESLPTIFPLNRHDENGQVIRSEAEQLQITRASSTFDSTSLRSFDETLLTILDPKYQSTSIWTNVTPYYYRPQQQNSLHVNVNSNLHSFSSTSQFNTPTNLHTPQTPTSNVNNITTTILNDISTTEQQSTSITDTSTALQSSQLQSSQQSIPTQNFTHYDISIQSQSIPFDLSTMNAPPINDLSQTSSPHTTSLHNVVLNTIFTSTPTVNDMGRYAPFAFAAYIMVLHIPSLLNEVTFRQKCPLTSTIYDWNDMINMPIHIVYVVNFDSSHDTSRYDYFLKERAFKQSEDVITSFTSKLFSICIPLSEEQIKRLVHIHVTIWEDLPNVITTIQQSALATRFDSLYATEGPNL